ncbi:MAG TPA: polysaccharide deacetylase family protein [Gemmatimonadales bacterium]|jgi:peptidoglycan/xylan/chitin deacetylase (PgdA/CDA1 family)|nr:polysaccharide deacetylase family protein [Gemmatimonadales bacterium]
MTRALIAGTLLLLASSPRCGGQSALPSQWGVAVLDVGVSTDARQEQLAVHDCLELVGIPFLATRSVAQAVRRPLVVIGGILANSLLTAGEREALYAYVERGGVVLATQVQGSTFFPLFGLTHATPSRTNFRLRFDTLPDPALRYVNRPEERTISLGDPTLYRETIWSTEYVVDPPTTVLARYENGTAAATVNAYGRGWAYALGLGFKETTLIPQLARSFEAARHWINWFEPSGDVFRLLVRALYEDRVHPFLLLHTVPDGQQTALCLSHDVDAQESFHNSLVFAKMEAALGVRSTFFVTTKYFSDSTDIGYYTADRVSWIRQVRALGFEVGSHSVSHAQAFDKFPVGSASVTQRDYDPSRPSIFGEVRVSKQLLDRDLHQQTEGFRAGYLRFPSDLLRVLDESDYRFDSSVSAQWVLTNFPFFGFRQRALGSPHSNIVEVPVTLDDSRGELDIRNFLTAATEDESLRTWLDVIRANAENNAISCLLIHPTDTTYKLDTERRLIAAVQRTDTWIGTVGALAGFWRGRARLHPELRERPGARPVIVLAHTRRSAIPPGQSLVVEAMRGAAVPVVRDADGRAVPVRTRGAGDRVLLLLPGGGR